MDVTSQAQTGLVHRFQCMASPCEVHCPQADRLIQNRLYALAEQEAQRIEHKFSRYRDDNLVAAINQACGWVEIDDETERLLDFAEACWQLSEGRFDITSGVLREVWRFDGSDRLPDKKRVAQVLKRVGWQKVQRRPGAVRLQPGMELDFGGIGKEYAVDRCFEQLRQHYQGDLLVNFGGDLRACAAATPWQAGVESLSGGEAEAVISLTQGGLATSGDSRRFLLHQGKRYSHVLDATTGWPVIGAPRSVTVHANTCVEAGMLATLALLHGRKAETFLKAQHARYWCLWGEA